MTIGWALLGPGRHAEKNVLPQMRAAADTRLVAIVSRDAERGRTLAREHGFARASSSLEDVLRDPEIQAVYDATPDGLHAGNIVACAEAGKHVLVEKPLAISVAEGERAIAACAAHGVKLGVVYNQRHEEAHLEARRMVREGAIGEIMLARANITLRGVAPGGAPSTTWRTDPAFRSGGTLLSLTDHAFDILSFLMDQRIVEAAAFSDATRDNPPNERVAGLLLKFSGDAIGQVAASGKTPFGNRPVELLGTKGTITIANSFAYLSGVSANDPLPRVELIDARGKHVWRYQPGECFRLEIEQFNRAIQGKGEPATSAREGLRAMKVAASLYEAMREGRVARIAD